MRLVWAMKADAGELDSVMVAMWLSSCSRGREPWKLGVTGLHLRCSGWGHAAGDRGGARGGRGAARIAGGEHGHQCPGGRQVVGAGRMLEPDCEQLGIGRGED